MFALGCQICRGLALDWRIGNALVDRSRIGPGLDCICGGLVKDYQICPGLASYCWIGDGLGD